MRIAITGGSGFVGTHLSRLMLDAGHEVLSLGTRLVYRAGDHPRLTYLAADTTQAGRWQKEVAEADIVYNLTGRTIFQRWTNKNKQAIYDSRVLTTRNIAAALPESGHTVLVSTSAVGYYGDCGDAELTESSPPGSDFLAGLARDWEAEAMAARTKGVRVAIARFGIVLGAKGGALAKMLPAFRFYMGGPLGNGQQWFPWIHIVDLVEGLGFLALDTQQEGVFNLTAPHPVRNAEMAAALGKALGRPAAMAAPAFMIKLMVGEMAGVLLGSQRALPSRLLKHGFAFKFPRIDAALEDLIQ